MDCINSELLNQTCMDEDFEQDDKKHGISAEEENYVCNISMMKIKDSEKSVDSNNEEDYILSRLYPKEVEVDGHEEEETLTDLVSCSANGDGLLECDHNYSGMRIALGVILRLVLPLANGVVRGFQGIRDVRFLRVLRNVAASRQALTNLVAFAANTISMNLSSVQVSHRIEPLLKLLKLRNGRDGMESLPDTPGIETPPSPTTPSIYSPFFREPMGTMPSFKQNKRKTTTQQVAPKCCTLNVVAEPPPGQPIRADIVFIHGLHGSLVNTWKQGLWENERHPEGFERPPKPPVRPPKRPRHSRSSVIHPPQNQKRPRFSQIDFNFKQSTEREISDIEQNGDYSFICGEPKDIEFCDGIEYSFPTFRLRINDNGRLLKAEIDSKITDSDKGTKTSSNQKQNKTKNTSPKPSAKDPDYSKCWPADWLPLDCPGVRVIALNYTTDQYLWRPLWKKKEARSNLIERSREMAELLIQHGVGQGHPIIWVGHSKGGLFVKQIIVDAWESGRPAMAPFWRSSKGVFFYSVPHRGSHLASVKAPLLTRSVELVDIEKNNKYLLDLHRRFAGLYHLGHLKIEVFSFVETALTLMSVLYLRIVGVDSADPGIGDVCGIRLDHREICKPRSRNCILYKELVNMINKVC